MFSKNDANQWWQLDGGKDGKRRTTYGARRGRGLGPSGRSGSWGGGGRRWTSSSFPSSATSLHRRMARGVNATFASRLGMLPSSYWRQIMFVLVILMIVDASVALGWKLLLKSLTSAVFAHSAMILLVVHYNWKHEHHAGRLHHLFDTATRIGYGMEVWMLLVTLAGCANFVALTYDIEFSEGLWKASVSGVDIFFLLCYALELLASLSLRPALRDRPQVFALAMLDFASVCALYGYSHPGAHLFGRPLFMLLFPLRFLRLQRGFKLFQVNTHTDVVQTAVLHCFLAIVSLLCTISGLIMAFEYPCESLVDATDGDSECHDELQSFHHALYFTVITVTTVGYGDITAATVLGQLFIAASVLVTLVFIPIQVSRVVDAIRKPHDSLCVPFPRDPHLCVFFVGRIAPRDAERVCEELLCEAEYRDSPLRVVACTTDTDALEAVSRSFMGRLVVLRGSALDPDMLDNAAIDTATLVVVVAGTGPEANEATICAISGIRRVTASRSVRIVAVVSIPTFTSIARSAGAALAISACELEMVGLAHACMTPGFTTLVSNLMGTYRLDADDEALAIGGHRWVNEYSEGLHTELFHVSLSGMVGSSFADAAAAIYEHGVVLLALVDESGEVHLCPSLRQPMATIDDGNARGLVMADERRLAALLAADPTISLIGTTSTSNSTPPHAHRTGGGDGTLDGVAVRGRRGRGGD